MFDFRELIHELVILFLSLQFSCISLVSDRRLRLVWFGWCEEITETKHLEEKVS
mgnify:CR=1 FL=1